MMSDATGPASYLMAGFGTSRTEPEDFATTDMVRAKRKTLFEFLVFCFVCAEHLSQPAVCAK
jgi:hypothetical protein